jgi:hypothetical protein
MLIILGSLALVSAQALPLNEVPTAALSDCGAVSCTTFLPVVFRNYPPPSKLEIVQAVQQPDNPVTLIANRSTIVRASITSTVAHANVSAWLYGYRDGAPLPGSPIAANNNPRTLKSSVNRGALNDTFNFQLPASWLNGTIWLNYHATNSTTFTEAGGPRQAQFITADPLHVTVVPVNYVCNSGGSGSTLPGDPPYSYVTDYTYRTYPVPSVTSAVHGAMTYYGPCTSSVPDPEYADWDAMLDAVTNIWWSEGQPDSYYYALVHVYCAGGCISGIGWIGYSKAAVGFDGFGASHSGAGVTHAHEVGHNHGRRHAPGCGASGTDPSFPYTSGGVGYIGDSAHPNYGFNISTQAIYPYTSYIDFMSYCDPEWISDYTYEALRAYALASSSSSSVRLAGDHSFLISGSIDPAGGQAILRPAFVLDIPAQLPEPGDYSVDLLDANGGGLAAYPFTPGSAITDRWREGAAFESAGFHMALPYIEGVSSIRVRRGDAVLGVLTSAEGRAPRIEARTAALSADGQSVQVNWSGSDNLSYLVRASADGGATWQTIGVDLSAPSVALNPIDYGGQSVLVEVQASDGLRTTTLRLGPYFIQP